MSDLLKLAERCEQATGPARDLDADICVHLYGYEWNAGWGIWQDSNLDTVEIPCLTASLDAAMTLVPEGMLWGVDAYPDHSEAVVRHAFYEGKESRAGTPALALCAAALRARHAQGEGHG